MSTAPKNNRRTGERWFVCDRSGTEYPFSRMRHQDGLRVGDDFYDEPGGQDEGRDPRALQLTGSTTQGDRSHGK